MVLAPQQAKQYQRLAKSKGDSVEVLALNAGHFELIAPGQKAWSSIEQLILNNAFKVNLPPGKEDHKGTN